MATETVTSTYTNGTTRLDAHSPPSITSPPPFPEDVPTAPLLRISLSKLQANDTEEVARFNQACEDLGFFYLDLRGADDDILADASKLFDLAEQLYDLPIEEKRKYDFASKGSYFGYKGLGAAVVDRNGRLDRNEFYNVSKDDILSVSSSLAAPTCLTNQRPLFKSFMLSAHGIVSLILNLLNTHLELPAHTLEKLHDLYSASGDQVRLIKAPPQPIDDRQTALGEHTDFGSVTVLFNRLGGLQVLPPGPDAEWCYVKPLPGHCIINLGDAMSKFSNGLLRSNIHRVVSPPGEQGKHTRYSLVYFSRPNAKVLMQRLAGSTKIPELEEGVVEEEINANDWITRRAMGHRVAIHGDKKHDWDAFQGTEGKSRRDRK